MSTKIRSLINYLNEGDDVNFEFPFFMVYLCAITSDTLSRLVMIKYAAEKRIFKSISPHLYKILDLTEKWRYSQAQATEIVSDVAPTEDFKDFLYKFSQSVSVGEPTSDFIQQYYKTWIAEYETSNLQALDRLKTLSDAYLPLVSVVLFMSTTMLFSTIFYEGETMIVLAIMIVLIISFILYIISWLIYKTAKPDGVLIDGQLEKTKNRIQVERVGYFFLLSSAVTLLIPIGWFVKLSLVGFQLGIGGAYGRRYISKVKKKEDDYESFFRYISSNLAADIPLLSVVESAVETDFNSLNESIENLYKKLQLRVEPKIAWWSFETELDSKLIRKINLIMTDTLYSGGDMEKASRIIEEFYHIYHSIQRKRYSAVSYHVGILVPLYVVMGALFGVIEGFFLSLNTFLGKLEGVVEFITIPSIEFMRLFFLFSLIIFAFNNVFSIYNMEGDSRFTLMFYSGIQLGLGSLFFLITNTAVGGYLSTIAFI